MLALVSPSGKGVRTSHTKKQNEDPRQTGCVSVSGKTLNVTDYAQVRFRLDCQPYNCYVHRSAVLNQSLPCVKGGAEQKRGGGIVKTKIHSYTIPQSASLPAPFTQGSLSHKHSYTLFLYSLYRQQPLLYHSTIAWFLYYKNKKAPLCDAFY